MVIKERLSSYKREKYILYCFALEIDILEIFRAYYGHK